MYTMVNLELDEEAKLDLAVPCVGTDKPMQPEYPWGLRITLTEKELKKLGLDPTGAQVGGMVHGHFMAKVTSVSSDQRSDGESHRVELQIQDLCIESEDAENEEAGQAQAVTRRSPRSIYKK